MSTLVEHYRDLPPVPPAPRVSLLRLAGQWSAAGVLMLAAAVVALLVIEVVL